MVISVLSCYSLLFFFLKKKQLTDHIFYQNVLPILIILYQPFFFFFFGYCLLLIFYFLEFCSQAVYRSLKCNSYVCHSPVLARLLIIRTLFPITPWLPPDRYFKIMSMTELISFLLNMMLFPLVFPIFSQVGNLYDPFFQILSSCRTSDCLGVPSHLLPRLSLNPFSSFHFFIASNHVLGIISFHCE